MDSGVKVYPNGAVKETEPLKKKIPSTFQIFEDRKFVDTDMSTSFKHSPNGMPLMGSHTGNQLPKRQGSMVRTQQSHPHQMQRFTIDAQKKEHDHQTSVEELMAKLAQQQQALAQTAQTPQVTQQINNSYEEKRERSDSSVTDPYANTPPTGSNPESDGRPDAAEVFRLKKELELATQRMAQMDLELTKSRIARHTVEEAIGSPFPAAQHLAFSMGAQSMMHNQQQPYAGRSSMFNLKGKTSQSSLRIDTGAAAPENMAAAQQFDSSTFYNRPSSGMGGRPLHQTGYTPPMTPLSFQAPGPMPNGMAFAHQAPMGSRLSPTASEFSNNSQAKYQAMPNQVSNYPNSAEPLNYRRLLDRTMSCNWKFIVDKIVCNNDQQASIFLQQKLKVGTADQKIEIVNSIIEQAYPLMVNRFGNFLVQRCFEHGTPQQVVAIAQAIRGQTLNLSMDAFGCHVVQKAFDCVPEEYKAIMVHELLRRIPETVIHRYACHVWQKLFELRWSDSPPQIMKYVNEALRGMWHEVALGETGSLVVQNIFENCLEEDKRPCVNEVLSSIDVVAHGQFGNWCIQHICEHGAVTDRTRAVDHVLRFASEYSMDQFASKVIEKCLKIGGAEFLDRYMDRVCEAHPERPRMPLIDIAGDQFGNYLIQYILTNADPQRREVVAGHIRKHMVSLRGSKYGSRVAMLCSNPALATRPGPPSGLTMSRNGGYNDRFGPDPGRGYSNDSAYVGMGRSSNYNRYR